MRITGTVFHQRIQHNLQAQLAGLDEAHERVTTGLRVRRPSDDPAAAADMMAADGRLRALTQYRRSIDSAETRLASEESVLGQLSEVLDRARELAVGQGTGTASTSSRAATRAEVDQLLQTVIQLGNTQLSGRFIFGGAHAELPPLQPDGTISIDTPATGESPVVIDIGQSVLTTHDAQTVFIDSDVIGVLQRLSTALATDDVDGIRAAATDVVGAHNAIQDSLGEVGARSSRLEVALANIDALGSNLQAFRSDLGEVEFEQAVTDLVNRQTAFQAALMATSRILSTTLTDYLR